MAYNNSGYPYQYPNQQQWPANFTQQRTQAPSQDQRQHPFQQSNVQQYQQAGQSYQLPSRQTYSNGNLPPSPQQVQQHYQYRTVPSPVMNYSPGIPQYDGINSPYGQSRQGYPPSQSFSPQQRNQYRHAQNQHVPSLPQRQLSYQQPQQFQRPSPQPSQGSIPPSPQMSVSPGVHIQQFHPPPQSPVFQTMRNNSVSSQSISRQSQSPVFGSRNIETGSTATGHRPIQNQRPSQSPVIPAHTVQQPLVVPAQLLVSQKFQPAVSQARNVNTNVPQRQHQFVSGQSAELPGKSQNQVFSSKPKITVAQSFDAQVQPIKSDRVSSQSTSVRVQPPASRVEPSASTNRVHLPNQAKSAIAATNISSAKQQKPNEQLIKQVVQQTSKPPAKHVKQPIKDEIVDVAKPAVKSERQLDTGPAASIKRIEEPSRAITEIDYALLLIDLSEELFDAAYGKPIKDRPAKKEVDLNVFYKLIATGLGCLEVVLKQWRSTLQPAVEAAVRLRYASVLHAETENVSEAEEVLSKGIAQCDKLRLLDFKYNMQHLLARVTFTTNPKAANKYLDTVIRDAEVQNHVPWIYAFRFLRASLSLEMQQTQETSQALNQLKIILTQAKSRGDIAVAATASAIEAMVHIHKATSFEAIEQAQTALTTVRSAENNPSVPKIPQLIIMAYFVDLICSLFRADSDTANMKMKAMHQSMDELANHESWTTDETFLVPIGQQSAKLLPGTTSYGAVVSKQAERTYLKLAWLPKNELYALGNMLGAATVMHKASLDKKCEELFDNADAFLKLSEVQKPNNSGCKSHEDLVCHLQVLRVFASCSKNAWSDAKKLLNNLKVKMANMTIVAQASLPAFIIYLEGMIAQGTGDTKTALALYNNPMLSLSGIDTLNRVPIINDLAILAALNTILIIHQPNHPQHSRMSDLLSTLEILEPNNPSNNIRGAYFLIRAIHSDASSDTNTNPILNTKNNLRQVLQIAKSTNNSQFSCISLTFMTDRFFTGQVGEQAHKSASTALNLARRGKNDLWTSVAESLLADCLETRGNTTEAAWRKEEALHLALKLPMAMQATEDS